MVRRISFQPSLSLNSGQRQVRLLLVEDHADLAEATAEFLKDAGLEVRIATSAGEALETATVFRPHIVLCDMHLPDMSGLDVARSFRANWQTKDVLFAMHTAMAEVDIQTLELQCIANEVNFCLSKPVTEQKLNRLLAGLAAPRRSPPPRRKPQNRRQPTTTRRAS
jgi:two-component system, sensor histidine kinase and response regulator